MENMNVGTVMIIIFGIAIIYTVVSLCFEFLPIYFEKRRRKNRTKRMQHELRFNVRNNAEPILSVSEEVQTTRCDECGRQFLFITTTNEEKRPFVCNCGNKLTWNVPYTRIEIESDKKIDYINLRHQKGWFDLLTIVVSSELDKNVKSITIKK